MVPAKATGRERSNIQESIRASTSYRSSRENSKDLHAAKPTSETVHAIQKKTEQREQTTQQSTAKQKNECYRCGGASHKASDCKFKDADCHYCKKKGHIARVCRSRLRKQKTKQAHQLTEESQTEFEDAHDMYMLLRTSGNKSKPIKVKMQVHNEELLVEVDTGASCSVISEEMHNKLWSNNAPKLNTNNICEIAYVHRRNCQNSRLYQSRC